MVRDCRPDDIGVSVSYPLPGTKFYAAVRQQLGLKQNWEDSNDLAMLYHGPCSTAFYRQLHRVLHREYRARKYWRDLRNLLRQPAGARPRHLRRTAALAYSAVILPIERRKLRRLQAAPHQGLPALGPALTSGEAAVPSPQGEA